ncbi:MAG: hypothetical protein COB71_12935 [Thiotrichales bacterium]|nr:MAG: hypothetical protein COB71_12935 [Thiotrichales bacterium]
MVLAGILIAIPINQSQASGLWGGIEGAAGAGSDYARMILEEQRQARRDYRLAEIRRAERQEERDYQAALAREERERQARLARKEEERRLELKYPNWIEIVRSDDFHNWMDKQDESVIALFKSTRSADAIRLLDQYTRTTLK